MNTKWTKKNEKWVEDDFQKETKKGKRKIKFNKNFKKAKNIGKVFARSFGKQAIEPSTLMLGGALGLGQGFKYNGNWKRGIVAGIITVGVFGTINGITNVAKYLKGNKAN